MPVLKPQDVVILLKLHIAQGNWKYEQTAFELRMSPQTVHRGVMTATQARLYDPSSKQPIRQNLLEFLVHGVKYAFPPTRGQLTRGVPTSWAASPLVSLFADAETLQPVWPFPNGMVRGLSYEPLFQKVPEIALADPRLAEYLALVDAIRDGSARFAKVAVEELKKRIKV